jgi:hypothetical protein
MLCYATIRYADTPLLLISVGVCVCGCVCVGVRVHIASQCSDAQRAGHPPLTAHHKEEEGNERNTGIQYIVYSTEYAHCYTLEYLHTVHTRSTYTQYIHAVRTYTQYIHAVRTCSTYMLHIHTVHTCSTYMQYVHAVHTMRTYLKNQYVLYLHQHIYHFLG